MQQKATSTNRVIFIQLTPPSLADNTADADRLAHALKKETGAEVVQIPLALLRTIPFRLRESNYAVRCVVFREYGHLTVQDILPQTDEAPACGVAVDLGTTRVVLRLVDLATGDLLGETAINNPQIAIAPDVLARIHHAEREGGLDELRQLIIDGINAAVGDLRLAAGVERERIYLMAVAGNTAMTHLFLGVPPHWIIREPYIPAVNRPGVLMAAELGIDLHPAARTIIFPNVGSYFGGDLIAGILYTGMDKSDEVSILVDVGTNAEVILGNREWLIACAGAAGPALESGVAQMGMMAEPGVIDTVTVDRETLDFRYETIGGLPPKGMCGSGIIDLAAEMFATGMLDFRGKLVPERCGDRFKWVDETPFIVVVPASESATGDDLGMGQADIDSLIRSKAAMYTILRTITNTVGLSFEMLSAFYVAGTFGSFIKPRSAITIGMIPDLPLETYKPRGNTSLGGATLALTDDRCMAAMDEVRGRITYLELNVNQELMQRFSAAKFLPHTDRSRFPSVRLWYE